jgi:hypothetical protein
MPFGGHFQGTYQALDDEKRVTNFNNFNKTKTITTFVSNTLPWHRQV